MVLKSKENGLTRRKFLKGSLISLGVLSLSNAGLIFAQDQGSEKIAGARKEGQVVYYTNVYTPETNQKLQKLFREKYEMEEFKAEYTVLGSADLTTKITQELRARTPVADLFAVHAPSLLRNLKGRGELMEYHSPEFEHYPLALKEKVILNDPGFYVAPHAYTFNIMYNPKEIKKDIKSWHDLLDDRFKGQIVMGDVINSSTYCQGYIALREVLGLDYFKKLADLKPFFDIRSTSIADRVVSAEYPIAFFGMPTRAYQKAQKGLGEYVKVVYPPEGSLLYGLTYAILARARHPNAAKLWIDFIFSKEAEKLIIEEEGQITLRDDIEVPPLVKKYCPPVSEIDYIPFDFSKFTVEAINEARAEFGEIFGR